MLARQPRLLALLLLLAPACAADPGDALKTAGDGGAMVVGSEGPLPVIDSGGAVQDSIDSGATPPPTPEAAASDDAAPMTDATSDVAPDVGLDDAMVAPEVVTCPTCPLELQYEVGSATASSQQIQFNFKIINHGSADQPLSSLKVRYYYTNDGTSAPAYDCDNAATNTANDQNYHAVDRTGSVHGAFAPVATPSTTADTYLEVSFTGTDTIPASGGYAIVQNRVHDGTYAMYNQSNDYSFAAADSAFTDSMTLVVFRDGAAMPVWGMEP